MRSKILLAGQNEIAQLALGIEDLEQYRDHADATLDLYETKRQNVLLEAELCELGEASRVLTDVKARLEDMARKEAEHKAREKRAYIERVIAGIVSELAEPKMQDRLLQRTLLDLEKIPTSVFKSAESI